MLRLVEERGEKAGAQQLLQARLQTELLSKGLVKVGYRGGSMPVQMFVSSNEDLWWANQRATSNAVPRYWNAFGSFDRDSLQQRIAVEINIPIHSNTLRVGGFFGEDTDTGQFWLFHTGKIGGGGKGVGKTEFLTWSEAELVEVRESAGDVRLGIPITALGAPGLVNDLRRFVRFVLKFKAAAKAGALNSASFRTKVDRYRKEFAGTKRGVRGGVLEYDTFHGAVVHALKLWRSQAKRRGEEVHNTRLIDLYVKQGDRRSEVYEVKMGYGRQAIYTAIGQLVVHASEDTARQFLVLPAVGEMPKDIASAIEKAGITVLLFGLTGTNTNPSVSFHD